MDGNLFNGFTFRKGFTCNLLKSLTKSNFGETTATFESFLSYACHAIGNGDGSEITAISEGFTTNRSDIIPNNYGS